MVQLRQTVWERQAFKTLDRNKFDTDPNFLVENKIFNTATNILVDSEHILNSCYEVHRKLHNCLELRSTRFLASFIPQSINVLNSVTWEHVNCYPSMIELPKWTETETERAWWDAMVQRRC